MVSLLQVAKWFRPGVQVRERSSNPVAKPAARGDVDQRSINENPGTRAGRRESLEGSGVAHDFQNLVAVL